MKKKQIKAERKVRWISFQEREAMHLFEWGLGVRQIDPVLIDNCLSCEPLFKRLRQFIGKKEADAIVRLVKKYPYSLPLTSKRKKV